MCFLDNTGNVECSEECLQNERHMCLHRSKDTHLVLGESSVHELNGEHFDAKEKRTQLKEWNFPEEGTQNITAAVDQINAQQVLANASQATALTVQDKGNSQIYVNSSGNRWSARQVPKRLPIRPLDNLKPGGEANFVTLHQLDYTQKSSDFASQYASTEVQQDSWDHRQIPKTLPIRKPDSLMLTGPLSLETTNKSDFNENVFQNKAAEVAQGETTHRPRTSLKLSGEFQSDSSYQRAFTPKKAEDVFKFKKGTSVANHLKPEGDMTFDTTSLDYQAAVDEKSKWESESERNVPLKPKPAKRQNGIKIPEVPLQDETTAVTDYRRWNVERPERHKPADTLQLTDGITDIEESNFTKNGYSDAYENVHDARWQVSRPVIRKPQNNLTTEGNLNFASASDIDYSSRRSRYSQSNLETVTERTEREAAEFASAQEISPRENQFISENRKEDSNVVELQGYNTTLQNAPETVNAEVIQREISSQDFPQQPSGADIEHAVSQSATVYDPRVENVDYMSQNGDQMEYVTWDQIRPKPIRPQGNLRQEGGMEFNTTNRSEFIERSSERVKGVRPKTTTKVFEGEFDATTMNQVMFSHDQVERVNPIRPKSNLHLENGQFADETTTAREYQQWEIKRPSPIIHKPSLIQQGSIDFTTTNQTQFEEKHPEKVYPIRPSTTNRISGEFDLTTTNQVMHGSFPIERVQKIVPQPNLRTSSGVFNSETTNRTQFQQYQIDRPKPIKPVPNLRQEGSMDFTTMNQLQFEEKAIEKVSQFRPQTSSKMTGDFDGVTTNTIMYAAQPMQKSQMIKPRGNLEVEKGMFARDTTNHSEFQQWQMNKPQAVTPRNNLQQEGDIDFTTTNQLQYAVKAGERVSQIRPKTNPKNIGEFDGTTTNRMAYQNIPGEKSKAVRPKTNIQMEKGNFGGETTNNREFQNWGYEKPSPIKPHSSIRQEGTMDFTTMNNMQFEAKTTERPTQIRPTTSTKITGDFDGRTMNQIMFQNNPLETVRGIRPSTHIRLENGKFENQTTAQLEYQQWEMSKAEPVKPLGTLVQEGTMDFTTSNQTEFGTKPITKAEPIRPHTSSPVTGEFDGTTTNQIMYQAQSIDKVRDIRPKDNLRIQSGEFKGETTTSQEYGYKDGTKPEPIKPKPNLSQEGDFDFVTSNQLQYEQKPIDRVSKTRPKTHTKIHDGKFYGKTTNQAMFQAPTIEPVHTARPSTNLQLNEGAFQSNTTVADSYQQWKAERPKAFQLVSSLKQEGDMSFETTNNSEFREKTFERVQQLRPKTSSKIEGDFVATTTNQAMFHQPDKFERVKPIRHQNNLNLEQGRFSDETTTNREYKQWVKMDNQIALPKKKLQTAGIKTQRERPNRRKEISKMRETNVNLNSEENEHEPWEVATARSDAPDSKIQLKSNKMQNDNTSNIKGDERMPSISKEGQPIGISRSNESISQEQTELCLESNENSKEISVMKSDYGRIQDDKESSRNLSKKTDENASKLSKSDAIFSDDRQVLNVQEGIPEPVSKEMVGNANEDSWKLADSERTSFAAHSKETKVASNFTTQEDQIPKRVQQNIKNIKGPKRYKPDDNLKIEHVPFDATSTTQTEYKKWEGRKSSSKRRCENLKQEGKMQFDTTSNDYSVLKDYQTSREATRPKIKDEHKKGSLTPTGKMEFSTTSKSSYVGTSTVAKAKNLRPRSSLRLGVSDTSSQEVMSSSRSNPEISSSRENYDLTSTSRASYVGYTGTRTRANRPSTSQKVGEGAFEGQSTTRSSFKVPQDAVAKQKTMKPENHNILHTDSGFSGDTTYKSSFETKKGHCPVLDLEAGKLPLAFNEERNGHLFYAPRVQG